MILDASGRSSLIHFQKKTGKERGIKRKIMPIMFELYSTEETPHIHPSNYNLCVSSHKITIPATFAPNCIHIYKE
jgi:hypothetical protein